MLSSRISRNEVFVNVLRELVVKFLALPFSQLFIVSFLCLDETFKAGSGFLNILTASDRFTGSHIFYCLVINFIRGFEFVLVV